MATALWIGWQALLHVMTLKLVRSSCASHVFGHLTEWVQWIAVPLRCKTCLTGRLYYLGFNYSYIKLDILYYPAVPKFSIQVCCSLHCLECSAWKTFMWFHFVSLLLFFTSLFAWVCWAPDLEVNFWWIIWLCRKMVNWKCNCSCDCIGWSNYRQNINKFESVLCKLVSCLSIIFCHFILLFVVVSYVL